MSLYIMKYNELETVNMKSLLFRTCLVLTILPLPIRQIIPSLIR